MNKLLLSLKLLFSWDDIGIEIQGDTAIALRGEVKNILLKEIEDLAKAHEFEDKSYILATSEKKFCRLKFIGIPKHLHQRFRNVWNANWKA